MDTFHAYIWGTAFWYSLRGAARIYDAAMVCGWFRHNVQKANDLELYTVHTDAWGLVTLALILLSLTDAMPITMLGENSKAVGNPGKKSIAKAVILATIFHHITTGYGAFQYWAAPDKYTKAMSVGVYGCAGLAILGVVALVYGMQETAAMPKLKKAA